MIRYLEHKDIDKSNWDRCIQQSDYKLIYAQSWFLDAVCPNWSALVLNDYEIIMPLPLRKKWGISYVFPPLFAQQLGVISKLAEKPDISSFIKAIPQKIRYVEIKFNEKNELSVDLKNGSHENKNYTLETVSSYTELYKLFSQNTKRNIRKALDANLQIDENLSLQEFLNFIRMNTPENIPGDFMHTLKQLIISSFEKKLGRIWAAKSHSGEIISAVFWIQSENRSYYLCPASDNEGKQKNAMFLLVNNIIQQLSEKSHILDFEGSNIEGVARFYKGFNAQQSNYQSLTLNYLPWPVKLLKR